MLSQSTPMDDDTRQIISKCLQYCCDHLDMIHTSVHCALRVLWNWTGLQHGFYVTSVTHKHTAPTNI